MYHDLLVNQDTSVVLIMIFIMIADDIINVIYLCLLLSKYTVNITVLYDLLSSHCVMPR